METSSSSKASTKGLLKHALYRREVCQLISASKNPILNEMETNLGRHALQYDHHAHLLMPIDMPARIQSDGSMIDMRVPSSIIHCSCCGACLQGRVRIQSIARGRTRRRRASRCLAKQKREQQRQSTRNASMRIGNISEMSSKLIAQLFQVTDGTCKNIVVQTCDTCSTQRKMKGLPVKSTPKSRTTLKMNKERNPVDVGNPRDPNRIAKGNSLTLSTQVEATSLIGSKKKKKKKSTEPKSALMDFLSKLNH